MNTLAIIDGYGFLFRAYHSLPSLKRPDGTEVGAVYGFMSMLLKVISKHEYSHLAVALDSGSKTFRNQIYPAYKANRPPAPEDLLPQFPILREAIKALNIEILEQTGYEADDLIATMANKATENNYKVIIISSDKDLMQLVQDNSICMFDAMKNITIQEKEVVEKFGVEPKKLLDTFALVGDTSDNIPGIPGIGIKTAAELINQFGNLENLYNSLDELKQNKKNTSIKENQENAFLSKKLISLCYDAPINISLDDLKTKSLNQEQLLSFIETQNFHSLLNRIKEIFVKHTDQEEVIELPVFQHIKTQSQLDELYKIIESKSIVSIFHNYEQKTKKGNDIYFAVGNQYYYCTAQQEQQLDLISFGNHTDSVDIQKFLIKLFASLSIKKITYKIKNLMHYYNIPVIQGTDDIDIMSYLVYGSNRIGTIYDLYSCLDMQINQFSSENQIAYIVKSFQEIFHILEKQLIAKQLYFVYAKIERPLINVLYNIETRGIKIDIQFLSNLSLQFKKQADIVEKQIFAAAGKVFNINSPKQIGEILFDELKIQSSDKTSKTKNYSTNADVLEELSYQGHKIADDILEWRHLTKLINTYTDSLPKLVDKNSRIHTTFLMTQTSTGRLSSIEPNLQNIPIKSEDGKLIRSSFIAKDGYEFISLDYSQIELRILAEIANVQLLKKAFQIDADIHKSTAAEIFNIEIANVHEEQRRKAKTINFGIIYGMSPFGLAKQLKIPAHEAKEFITMYFDKFPEIKNYINDRRDFARRNGFVKTYFGRRCYFDFSNSNKSFDRGFIDRAAINAPIQGTQADIIKLAMNKIEAYLVQNHFDAQMVLQIHDELVLEVKKEQVEQVALSVQNIMEKIVNFAVKLKVDIKISNNLGKN